MKKIIIFILLPFFGIAQQSFNFNHNGISRDYIFYSPNNISINSPLVFVAHGYTGSAQDIMNYSGMNAIADQYGFAVCYPQGTYDSWGNRFWNVGYDFTANSTIDDVDFIISLATYLQSTYNLSSENTFFTGMSNGAELSYLLACEATNNFKAFAPVAGTIFPNGLNNNICNPSNGVSIFEIHGLNDDVTLFEGDENDEFWGPYLGIDSIISFWVNESQLTNLIIDTFPNFNNPNKKTISYKYSSEKSDNQVWLYTHQSGHNWGDDGDMIIEEEIWDFFQAHLVTSTLIDDPDKKKKKLIGVKDILGRVSVVKKKQPMFYFYDDGTVEKRLIID